MSDAPRDKNTQPGSTESGPGGRTGKGVASVLPFLHKQVQVKIPVPIDELPVPEGLRPLAGPTTGDDKDKDKPVRQSAHERRMD
jgi:hypothetical protein